MPKGRFIYESGLMGLDWRFLDLSSFLEAREAYNAAHNPEERSGGNPDALAKVMAARGA